MADAVASNGLGPKTTIVSLGLTDIALDAEAVNREKALSYFTNGDLDGTTKVDTYSVAGLTIVSDDLLHVALQGTGTLANIADVEATGVAMVVLATFDQA